MKFIIEHLEPELFEWCLIEYEHISEIVGKNNLIFTNINPKFFSLIKNFGKVFNERFSGLNKKLKFNENKICVLSQYAQKTLETDDKNKFEYFVFGGILGDKPAKNRTNFLIQELKNSSYALQACRPKSRQIQNIQICFCHLFQGFFLHTATKHIDSETLIQKFFYQILYQNFLVC